MSTPQDGILSPIDLTSGMSSDSETDPNKDNGRGKGKGKEPEIDKTNNNNDYTNQEFYQPIQFGEFGKYMQNKRSKLQIQQREVRENAQAIGHSYPQIFEGLTIHLNGDANVSNAYLSQLVTLHGGTWTAYLDRKSEITHILATNLTPKKREEFASYRVVLPSWILESVEQGRLLDWRKFRLSAQNHDPTKIEVGSSSDPWGSPSKQQTLWNVTKDGNTKQDGPSTPSKKRKYPALTSPFVSTSADYQGGTDPASPYLASKAVYEGYYPAISNARAGSLLSNEQWRLKHTAANPDFVSHYFNKSRLHYLSAARSDLSAMVARLSKELGIEKSINNNNTSRRQMPLSGKETDGRTIFHIDLDCFFVSAGLVSRPHLCGKPVAVCHSREGPVNESATGEIASSSYEAREFGIKNGMSLHRAKNLCPDLITIPYEFDAYKSISEKFYKILLQVSSELQPVSVDEMYVDVSKCLTGDTINEKKESSLKLAQEIRTKIKQSTGCEASIGSSYNMLLARMATRQAKPASAYHVTGQETISFLANHKVDDLPGVGHSIRDRIKESFNVSTISELLEIRKGRLQQVFGLQQGEMLYNYARGIDPRPLTIETPTRKSVSADINYGIRLESDEEVKKFMFELSKEVSKRLQELNLRGTHLILNIMARLPEAPIEPAKFLGHGPCYTQTKTQSLASATDDTEIIYNVSHRLLESLRIKPCDLRGVGICMQKLKPVPVGSEKGKSSQPLLNFRATKKVGPNNSNNNSKLSNTNLAEKQKSQKEPEQEQEQESLNQGQNKQEDGQSETEVESEDEGENQKDEKLPSTPTIMIQSSTSSTNSHRRDSDELIIIEEKPAAPSTSTSAGERNLNTAGKRQVSASDFNLTMSQVNVDELNSLPHNLRQEVQEIMYNNSKRKRRKRVDKTDEKEHEEEAEEVKESKNDHYQSETELKQKQQQQQQAKLTDSFQSAKNYTRQARINSKGTLVVPKKKQKLQHQPNNVINCRPPSPRQITDDQLYKMGIVDVSFFRTISRQLQLDAIRHSWSEMDQLKRQEFLSLDSTGKTKYDGNDSKQKEQMQKQKQKFEKYRQVSIFGKSDMEDIRTVLEQWVEMKAKEGPFESDIQHFVDGLTCLIGTCPGQDVSKVCSILSWWKRIIQTKLKQESASDFNHDEWSLVLHDVITRVNDVAVYKFGSRLRL